MVEEWRCTDCDQHWWVEDSEEHIVTYCPFCGAEGGAVEFVDVRAVR